MPPKQDILQVSVAYAEESDGAWLSVEVPDGATVREAIEHSGILERFPHIDLDSQKVGIFGKVTQLENPVQEGDRVEIYRPIIADPKTVRRRAREGDNQ